MKSAERGSIVIEAMIATLIIAALAGALFEVIAARSAAARRLDRQRAALLVAQSRLAELDLRASEVPGTAEGGEGSFRWRARATPFHADEASGAGTLAFVSVSVRDAASGRPLVLLDSLRLVR